MLRVCCGRRGSASAHVECGRAAHRPPVRRRHRIDNTKREARSPLRADSAACLSPVSRFMTLTPIIVCHNGAMSTRFPHDFDVSSARTICESATRESLR
ncbi:hypothetical protein WS83_07890 [Burkholderia sp. MSMB2042]|nr:hypothetical protein WS78_23065 [Burkholderia savannae]KVG47702.1 hypothetical protein WS77_27645 [Burkholderia sp. MSMB0265]KVG80589.1 hypothetical protein WS81_12990 [Burkholderia sp. MSMB2040]KVG94010.1 hypothetical protein WS83_07890 [Burkholderia sp. MSMB2042]KVG96653.1 hypothetical protein WS82_31575 [Burkholderia sp. MSMB2041]